jgi:hypothetical protein
MCSVAAYITSNRRVLTVSRETISLLPTCARADVHLQTDVSMAMLTRSPPTLKHDQQLHARDAEARLKAARFSTPSRW